MKAIHTNIMNKNMMFCCDCMCMHVDTVYWCVPSYLSS